MLYEEARVYLDHVSKYGSVLGLDSIKGLLNKLGNPQQDLTFIQIAGTNGKGSILCYLSEILTNSGYVTGRYSSPAVMDELEIIQVDGVSISEEEMGRLTETVKEASELLVKEGRPAPTLFETETAIALLYFKERLCDIVILETGLGGGLDATNVVENTILDVFAPIGMDHMAILGNTIEEIAEKKAGIIKSHAAVVSAPQKETVLAVLKDRAEEKNCPLYQAETEEIKIKKTDLSGQVFSYKQFENLKINMAGKYQTENAATAIEAVLALRKKGFHIEDQAVCSGLANARWRGRFDRISENPLIILDGAHNIEAAKRLSENVNEYLKDKNITAIIGIFKDKEYKKIIQIMAPCITEAYPVELPNEDRTLTKEDLTKELQEYPVKIKDVDGIEEAVRQAVEACGRNEVILIFGSLSHLGKVKALVDGGADNHGR